MAWRIEFNSRARRDFGKLDYEIQRQIRTFLRTRIESAEDPRNLGKALTADKRGLWRYRVGDYRLICQIQDEVLLILILEVGHRRDIYR